MYETNLVKFMHRKKRGMQETSKSKIKNAQKRKSEQFTIKANFISFLQTMHVFLLHYII